MTKQEFKALKPIGCTYEEFMNAYGNITLQEALTMAKEFKEDEYKRIYFRLGLYID